jgi:sulfotransferase family protein
LTVFRLDEIVPRARSAKALPLLLREKLISNSLTSKKQELRQLKTELLHTSVRQKRIEYKKRKKRVQQEIFRLNNDLRRAAAERSNEAPNGRQAAPQGGASESATGAMPAFLIIGAKKCGTTFLYDLLTRHPHVEPAAKKELHYFDILYEEESIKWYRRCFPAPRWKDGRRTITGEATPYLDASHVVPERVARMLPRARVIALLRNPVDRAYSDYQQARRKGREPLTFEEAIEVEKTQTLARRKYLSRSTYADHLLRWSRFFAEEQMLVLKSEDFFERTQDTLECVLNFLGLPNWELEASEKRNKGKYEAKMDPTTRQRLEEYFEPHNERLYEHLGVDFEWQQLRIKN